MVPIDGPLDRLMPLWRHLIIVLLGAFLSWLSTDCIPILNDHGGYGAIVGAILAQLILIFTPATEQYGVRGDHAKNG